LLVASAGNFAEDLDQNASENRPASLEGFDDRMIVVGALQPNDPDHPFWPDSARSPTHVHIAAPGALISSLGTDGQDLCDSGTSAAAPLVSFTAAMLRSLTGAPREIVRSRLLAAADHEPKLQGMVEDNRRLNVEAALDIFVDRVETDGGLKRGWIEPQSAERLVSVCKPPGIGRLAALRGKIDLSLLWEWWKKPDKQASIRHQIDERHFNLEKCDVPDGTFSFFDLATGVAADIPWSSVKKVLPTPFRAVKAIILKSNDQGEVRQ
jgi:hypothetical protein